MNKLANGLGKNASSEVVIGASEEVITGLFDYFSLKGLKVVLLEKDDCLTEDCDVVLYEVDWEEESVYMLPFREDGYCPNITISLNYMPTERVLDHMYEFLEAIKFI